MSPAKSIHCCSRSMVVPPLCGDLENYPCGMNTSSFVAKDMALYTATQEAAVDMERNFCAATSMIGAKALLAMSWQLWIKQLRKVGPILPGSWSLVVRMLVIL